MSFSFSRYLISSAPRSGGNLVQAILHSCRVPVVHTHDPLCRLDHYESTGLIILRRRDIFAAAMSNCIVWETGQTIDYVRKEIKPIEISEQSFIDQLGVQVNYRKNHDFTKPYGAIFDFDFEDFVHDNKLIVDRLGLVQDTSLLNLKQLNNPAPYNYKQVVKNYKRLREIFDGLDLDSLKDPFESSYGKEYANYN